MDWKLPFQETFPFTKLLRPTDHHLAVVEYVRPEQFQSLKEKGDAMGFKDIDLKM